MSTVEYVTGEALVALERGHLVRLAVWALASIAVGLVAAVAARRLDPAVQGFWRHFGIQSGAWGAVDLLIVGAAWNTLSSRDVAAAIALDRFLWLNIGLDAGYVMVGVTLLVFGLRTPRRSGLIGAGTAVIAQGLALIILDAQLSAYIVR